jgi:hypothetical protein
MNSKKNFSFELKKDAAELASRFLIMLDLVAPARGGFSFLKSKTGVSYERWRNVSSGRQAPSIELLLALCYVKPEWSLWLLTGQIDEPQHAPSQSDLVRAIEARAEWDQRGSKKDTPAGPAHWAD